MLFGPMVEGVPAQVLGVRPVRMARGHGHEQRGDVAASGGEDVGDLVRGCAGQQHVYRPYLESACVSCDFGVTRLDHAPEPVAPVHLRRAEHLMHVGDVGPQWGVGVGGVLKTGSTPTSSPM